METSTSLQNERDLNALADS